MDRAIKRVDFQPHHLESLDIQDTQGHLPAQWNAGHSLWLASQPSYSVIKDGRTLISAGVVTRWAGTAMCWSYLAKDIKSDFLLVHREVADFLDLASEYYRRLEMYVDHDHNEGHRWAKMLGFHIECERMKSFTSNGKDATLYVRLTGE